MIGEECGESYEDPEVLILVHRVEGPLIRARHMTLGDYLELRDWSNPGALSIDSPGYLIQDQSSKTQNCEGYQGFIAWLSKPQFEEYYERLGTMNS